MKSLRKSTAVKKNLQPVKKTAVKLPEKTDSSKNAAFGVTLTVPDDFPLDAKNLKISTKGRRLVIEFPDNTVQGLGVGKKPIPRPKIEVILTYPKK